MGRIRSSLDQENRIANAQAAGLGWGAVDSEGIAERPGDGAHDLWVALSGVWVDRDQCVAGYAVGDQDLRRIATFTKYQSPGEPLVGEASASTTMLDGNLRRSTVVP
jgi:hypothetical protein